MSVFQVFHSFLSESAICWLLYFYLYLEFFKNIMDLQKPDFFSLSKPEN